MDDPRTIRRFWRRLCDTPAGAARPAVRLLLPREVLRELDQLKKCLFRRPWAQAAVRLLLELQAAPHAARLLRGQR